MALRKKAQTIDIDKIRPGQVLEITYGDKENNDTSMILVISPDYQGKLTAIKLTNLSELDMEILIGDVRSVITNKKTLSDAEKKFMYDTFINSPYAMVRPYRNYFINKILAVKRITLGQAADVSTVKYSLANGSVLYGVTHGNFVHIAYDDYEVLYDELHRTSYSTYFEGPRHEDVTKTLLKLLMGKVRYKEATWEPPHDPNLYIVTELFGGDPPVLWKQIREAITKNEVTLEENTKLIQVVADATMWWSDRKDGIKYTVSDIKNLLNDVRGDTSFYDKLYSEVSEDEFVAFHKAVQIQAFAEYEGRAGKKFIGSPLQLKQQAISNYRRKHLRHLMETKPGVYFAGVSHVEDFIKGGA